MIETSEKYNDMINGGSDKFSVKQILLEFIREQKKFNDYLIKELMPEVKTNSTAITYIKAGMGIILSILFYLVCV